MIKRLDWDSECFGYKVGMIGTVDAALLDPVSLPEITKGYRLVYIFSEQEIAGMPENAFLADRKTVFERNAGQHDGDYTRVHSYHGEVTDALLRLAYISGEYSRFKRDSLFVNDEFRKLYGAWIGNSVSRKIADEMLVWDNDGIKGFITLAVREGVCSVGLVAVDPKHRGKGIGTALIRSAMSKASEMGCDTVRIVTQKENSEGVALYKSNGFKETAMTMVYHYRNATC